MIMNMMGGAGSEYAKVDIVSTSASSEPSSITFSSLKGKPIMWCVAGVGKGSNTSLGSRQYASAACSSTSQIGPIKGISSSGSNVAAVMVTDDSCSTSYNSNNKRFTLTTGYYSRWADGKYYLMYTYE